ncbi:MAG: hypothetical protein JNM25_10760 [Planctomycetes bacterium]|nr:hypothetical protein [Planctomycetota bacterium]
MIDAGEPVGWSPWRSLFDSPLLVAAWGAIVCGCLAMLDVGAALERAESVRKAATPELARIAAETALAEFLDQGPAAASARVVVGDVVVNVARREGEFRLVSEVGDGGVYRFCSAAMPGAAPGVFAHACSAVDPTCAKIVAGSRLITAEDLPRLDPVQLAAAARGDQLASFRLDQGIALLSWESGTDKPDYVLDANRIGDLDQTRGLVVLPGNLWIEVGEQPLRLRLQRDHVVVVQGNLYVGRSILVDGPGRLVLVTRQGQGERSFADLDANGRWSRGDALCGPGEFAGPFEGAGNVYLGLPGSSRALVCDASLVVDGQLHIGTAARLAGPLVLGHGVQAIAVGARLEACRQWAFHVDRECVPGFVTDGVPRPGVLVRAASPTRSDEQGLYLSAPAR